MAPTQKFTGVARSIHYTMSSAANSSFANISSHSSNEDDEPAYSIVVDNDDLVADLGIMSTTRIAPEVTALIAFLDASCCHKNTERSTGVIPTAADAPESSNIVVRSVKGGSYYVHNNHMTEFFRLLKNTFKLEKAKRPQVCEAQYPPGIEVSGFMFDFDLKQTDEARHTGDKFMHNLVHEICKYMFQFFQIENMESNYVDNHEIGFTVGVTRRPNITPHEGAYKGGFHVLIPNVKGTKAMKKFIMGRLKTSDKFLDIWDEIPLSWPECRGIADTTADGVSGDDAIARRKQLMNTIDDNAATVPVFFVGSASKPGSSPYVLDIVYDVTVNGGEITLNALTGDKFDNYKNNPRAMSLSHTGHDFLQMAPKPHHAASINQLAGLSNQTDDLVRLHDQIKKLSGEDTDAEAIKKLIDILPLSMSTNYMSWDKVIRALASKGATWKPLGEWFSRKSGAFNAAKWDHDWSERLGSKTVSMSYIWGSAKKANPEAFKKVRDDTQASKLNNVLRNCQYDITHLNAAEIFQIKHGDHLQFSLEGGEKRLYMMAVPGGGVDTVSVGIWKWVPIPLKDLDYVIGKVFRVEVTRVLEDRRQSLNDQFTNTQDPDKQAMLKKLMSNCTKSIKNVGPVGFIPGALTVLSREIYTGAFAQTLDKYIHTIGVRNGILQLGPKANLIEELSTFRISLSTNAAYIPYDPQDPITRDIMEVLCGLFLDTHNDSFNSFMHMLAQLLGNGAKPQCLVHLLGRSTGNGKSTISSLVESVLGDSYSATTPSNMFDIGLSSSSEAASPAMIAMSTANAIWFHENTPNTPMASKPVKTITGGDKHSGRLLFSSVVKSFTYHALLICLSNGDLMFDNFVGIERRYRGYEFLKRFYVADEMPDTQLSEYEGVARTEVIKKWPKDPRYTGRMLGIMVMYSENLYRYYENDFTKVESPHCSTINASYVESQDSLVRFIRKRICRNLSWRASIQAFTASELIILDTAEKFSTTINIGDETHIQLVELEANIKKAGIVFADRASEINRRVITVHDPAELTMTDLYEGYSKWHKANSHISSKKLTEGEFISYIKQHKLIKAYIVNGPEGDYIIGHTLATNNSTYVTGPCIPLQHTKHINNDESLYTRMTTGEYVDEVNRRLVANKRLPTGLVTDTFENAPMFTGELTYASEDIEKKSEKKNEAVKSMETALYNSSKAQDQDTMMGAKIVRDDFDTQSVMSEACTDSGSSTFSAPMVNGIVCYDSDDEDLPEPEDTPNDNSSVVESGYAEAASDTVSVMSRRSVRSTESRMQRATEKKRRR